MAKGKEMVFYILLSYFIVGLLNNIYFQLRILLSLQEAQESNMIVGKKN